MTQRIKTVKEYVDSQKEFNWEGTGILDGLSASDAEMLKAKMEEMAQLILNLSITVNSNTETLIFSIMRRAFCGYNYLINNCYEVLKYVDSKIHAVDIEWSYSHLDIEAEFCDLMAKDITNLQL